MVSKKKIYPDRIRKNTGHHMDLVCMCTPSLKRLQLSKNRMNELLCSQKSESLTTS